MLLPTDQHRGSARKPLGTVGIAPPPFVCAGVAVTLFITKQPSSETTNTGPLEDQPVLVLLDAAHNPVVHPKVPKGAGLVAVARTGPSSPNATDPPNAVFTEGIFAFRSHALRPRSEFCVAWPRGGYGYGRGVNPFARPPPVPGHAGPCYRARLEPGGLLGSGRPGG